MFVRKGTIRKGRGGANRRSATRKQHRPEGTETTVSPTLRTYTQDTERSISPGGHSRNELSVHCGANVLGRVSPNCGTTEGNGRVSPNRSILTTEKVDGTYFTHTDAFSLRDTAPYIPEIQKLRNQEDGRGHNQCPKPSPSRSIAATVISFDDERQLVRTSVGWENHMNVEGPPDYGALMYQINEARKESDNIVDFGCKTYTIICNTLLVTIFVGISIACPIAMVSVGVKYLDDCPIEPRIPIYLLVGGCFGMIKLMSTLWRNIQARRYQDIESVFDDNDMEAAFANTTYRTMDTILFLFLIGWQIAGTYWTVKIWTPNFQQILHEPSNWCDETVYMFSIYQLCCSYFIMVVFVLLLTSLMCCHKCCYR